MVTEVAILKIDPADAKEFEKMYVRVSPILREQTGYISDKLMRAIERQEEYILLVEWESVKSHQDFIDSENYKKMSDPIGNFVIKTQIAHFNTLTQNN